MPSAGPYIDGDSPPTPQRVEAARRLYRAIFAILDYPGGREDFDRLVRAGCDRFWLASRLAHPVALRNTREGNAETRKMALNQVKAFRASLVKTRKLARPFHDLAGVPELEEALDWLIGTMAERPPHQPVPLFTVRQCQEFDFLNGIRKQTGRPHYREAANLLAAVYTASGIPQEEHPCEDSLEKLVRRSRSNSAAWRKAMPKIRQEPEGR
jgi:hypothetical protein